MSRHAPSPLTLDLFDHVPAAPQRSRRMLPKVATPPLDLTSVPDARLGRLLVEVTTEVQRRWDRQSNSAGTPELKQATQEAARVLEAMLPRRPERAKRSTSAEAAPSLQPAKRQVIRKALQAGVSPGQVAKHFGLSLAAVREALAEAE